MQPRVVSIHSDATMYFFTISKDYFCFLCFQYIKKESTFFSSKKSVKYDFIFLVKMSVQKIFIYYTYITSVRLWGPYWLSFYNFFCSEMSAHTHTHNVVTKLYFLLQVVSQRRHSRRMRFSWRRFIWTGKCRKLV